MNNELLPCPFCGANDLRQVVHDLSDDDEYPFGYSIGCNSCFVDLPPEQTQSDCFKAWNTRADKTAPAPPINVEALKREQSYSIDFEPHKHGFVKGWNACVDYLHAPMPEIDGLENALLNAVKPAYDAEKAEWVLYCGGEKSANAILKAAREYLKISNTVEDKEGE